MIDNWNRNWKFLVGWVGLCLLMAFQLHLGWIRTQDWHGGWKLRGKHIRSQDPAVLLFEGLHWVRDHTGPSEVMIGNLFTSTVAKDSKLTEEFPKAGFYYYYSAVAERRMFVEGWVYLQPESEVRRRLQLADSIFLKNNMENLEELKRTYQVSLIFIDKRWPSRFQANSRTQLVFSNSLIEVYRVL